MQTILFYLTVTHFLYHGISASDLTEEVGCHNTEFRLSCEASNGSIAVLHAIFSLREKSFESVLPSCGDSTHVLNSTRKWGSSWEGVFHSRVSSNSALEVSFRHAVNRRCSGVKHCSFTLDKDFDSGSALGPGAVYLRYACVNDAHATTACNANVNVTEEGFVRTPGYPEYYIGETTCVWTLTAPPPQRVRVTFLDVSLRGPAAPFEVNCLDWLVVTENGLNLLSTCGDVVEDTTITSDGSALNVTFRSSSKTLFPKRGLLFHYKAVGCLSLRKPKDGYLINKNETFAHYRCCVGFIFPDTLTRDKILNCYNENTWDGVVLDCVNITTETSQNQTDLAIGARTAMEKPESIIDVIVPSVLMCVLFIGNGIVLYVIHRKRKQLKTIEKTELEEIPSSREA